MSRRYRRSDKNNKPGARFQLDPEASLRIEEEFSEPPRDWANYEPPEYDDDGYDEDFEEAPPRKKRSLLRRLLVRLIILGIIVILIDLAVLFFTGQIWFNEPKKRDYPIRGPVITEKMGKIDWERFSQQNIQMAYIRATKSTTYVDESFEANRKGALTYELPVGMLHIFDLNMSGSDQARHFIDTVADRPGDLPPAVEVERRGLFKVIPLDEEKLKNELEKYVTAVRDQYGIPPVIKCTGSVYDLVSKDDRFADCPIWYVSEYTKPEDEVSWDFWGYSSRVKFSFYENDTYLEMTLWKGSEEEFSAFLTE